MESKRILFAVITVVVLALLVVFIVVIIGRNNDQTTAYAAPSAQTNGPGVAPSRPVPAVNRPVLPNGQTCAGVPAGKYVPEQYPNYSPEPFASLTDIITASQYVENAIHGSDKANVQENLAAARAWLCHAQKYFDAAYDATNNEMKDNYKLLAGNIQYAALKLDMINANVPDTGAADYAGYLAGTVYSYMGDLSYLYRIINDLFNVQQPEPQPEPPQPAPVPQPEVIALSGLVTPKRHGSPPRHREASPRHREASPRHHGRR